jgi:hypothetical protein
MEKTNNLVNVILLLTILGIIAWGLSNNHTTEIQVITSNVCKEDSLRNVIDSLNTEIKTLNDGFDSKEQRYEDIIYELEQKKQSLNKL